MSKIVYQLIKEGSVSTGIGVMYLYEVNSEYDNPEDALDYLEVLKRTFPHEDCSYRVEVRRVKE